MQSLADLMEQADRIDAVTATVSERPWTHLMDRALGQALTVPTMLSREEQQLYYWLTAIWADGAGDVVDLGCFAGGSTARLAQGPACGGVDAQVHAFDRFTAKDDVKQSILYKQGVDAFDGDDILPLAKTLLQPWDDRITLHRGEIDKMEWHGGPIELLVMDASKAAGTMDAMNVTFLPHLVPGRALVVQQDFLHWSQPWVAAHMECLSDCFSPLVHVPRDTVVFHCHRPPTLEECETALLATKNDAAILRLLQKAKERYADWGLGARVDEMIAAMLANPGCRRAYLFERP